MIFPRKLRHALAGLILASVAVTAAAASGADSSSAIADGIHAQYPKLKIKDVRPAPIPGLYEVFTGSQLVYSDARGEHLFVGKLIDTHSGKDLASESLDDRLAIDFKKLPFERAIKIVKGTGARQLALFEDPDCPFCQQLEQQLANVTDVTLFVFLFPLTELHPQARVHAHAIWCAKDHSDAWTHWMLERKDPGSTECSGDPIDELQTLGNDMDVTGTPTWFLANGRRYQGVFAAAQLQQLLQDAGAQSSADTSHKLAAAASVAAAARKF